MSTSSRVIKNTSYLYVKMAITIFISLYTTRLILASLGASDFGIFNIVGGAIAMLGFLNSTLANATQRFMSYAEGQGQIKRKRQVFNVSVVLHILIACVTVLLLLAAMRPFFYGILNIDTDRIFAAKIVYLCLVFSTMLTIINVPYDAVMNAHENMLYYSIIGIFESLLRLAVAYAVVYTTKDKLVLYGVLMTGIPLITLTIMKVYCHRHYEECVISPHKYWDGSLVKQIAGFSGWNFLTAISSLFSAQGIGIVLNHFFGTILNAAQGVANQVNGALSNFSENMMKALNPVITKNAGSGQINSMNRATIAGCKFSAMLTMFFAIPLSLEVEYILGLWLKEVPPWAALFVVLQLIQSVILQMGKSASTAVYAQGNIKQYAIWKSIMNAMPVFLVWLAFTLGGSPIWLYIPMIVVLAIGGNIVIVSFAHKQCGLDISSYIKSVVLPIVGSSIIMIICGAVPVLLLPSGFIRLIIACIATTLGLFVSALLFAISKEEQQEILGVIKEMIGNKTRRLNRVCRSR